MNVILIILVAISLSMDAFSLSLSYGMLSLTKKEINTLSIVVGIYHFFMPLIGMLVGNIVMKYVNGDLITLIIFAYIGINMIIESFKSEQKINKMKIRDMLLFGLAVSIDSFSIGVSINSIGNNCFLCFLSFSISSFIFTYTGLILGKKLSKIIGNLATLIGGISLIILGIVFTL